MCDSQRVERKLCSAERTVTVVEIIRLESSEQVIDSVELTLAFARVGDRVDVREAARKMIMLRLRSLLSSLLLFFLFLSPLMKMGMRLVFSLSLSLSCEKEKESLFVIRLIPRLVLFRLNRKPLCGEVSREARCTAEAAALLHARYPSGLILVSGIRNGNYEAIKRGNADLLDRMDGR